MDASNILNDEMTLEEKLKAIEEAMEAVAVDNIQRIKQGLAPIDPAMATICDGCE